MSPHIAIFNPSIFPFLLIIVSASNNAWVGCSLLPSPALITAQLTFWDNKFGAPESWCLITIKSGCIAFKVIAVSIKVSPFLRAELSIFIVITSAPNLLPAKSNELWVLVDGSKNKLICVFPLKISNFFELLLFNFMNSLASFKISLASRIDRFGIPRRCLGDFLIAVFFFLTAIKINSIGV